MKLGDGLALLFLMIWAPVQMGHPEVAVGMVLGAMALNALQHFIVQRRLRKARAEFDEELKGMKEGP